MLLPEKGLSFYRSDEV